MFENFVLSRNGREKDELITISLILFILFAVGFVFLSLVIAYYPVFRFDIQILSAIQSWGGPVFSEIMRLVSFFGEMYFAPFSLLLVMGVLFYKGYKKEAVFAPVVLVGSAFAYFSKDIIGRPRPPIDFDSAYPTPPDFSFPSGHVVFYTLLFGLLAFLATALPRLERKWRILLLAVSVPLLALVGLSRVYLGVHWPTDVVGGYLLGFALLEMYVLIYLKFVYLPQVRNK